MSFLSCTRTMWLCMKCWILPKVMKHKRDNFVRVKNFIKRHLRRFCTRPFNYPDSRLSGLFTEVSMSPDNRGLTVYNHLYIRLHASLHWRTTVGNISLVLYQTFSNSNNNVDNKYLMILYANSSLKWCSRIPGMSVV